MGILMWIWIYQSAIVTSILIPAKEAWRRVEVWKSFEKAIGSWWWALGRLLLVDNHHHQLHDHHLHDHLFMTIFMIIFMITTMMNIIQVCPASTDNNYIILYNIIIFVLQKIFVQVCPSSTDNNYIILYNIKIFVLQKNICPGMSSFHWQYSPWSQCPTAGSPGKSVCKSLSTCLYYFVGKYLYF